MLPIIISAPHACTTIRDKKIRERIALNDEQIWKMSDPFTDRLEFFDCAAEKHCAPTHRILSDFNRAPGVGAFREKDFFGNPIFRKNSVFTESEKREILQNNWFPYHEKIIASVQKLENEGAEKILLIDLHNTSGDHALNKKRDYMPALVLSNLGGSCGRHPFLSFPQKNLTELCDNISQKLKIAVETNYIFHGGYEIMWFSHLPEKLAPRARLFALQIEYNSNLVANPLTRELSETALEDLYRGLDAAIGETYASL